MVYKLHNFFIFQMLCDDARSWFISVVMRSYLYDIFLKQSSCAVPYFEICENQSDEQPVITVTVMIMPWWI